MKRIITFLSMVVAVFSFNAKLYAQGSYPYTDYAKSGDTLYLTSAQIGNTNYDTTGAGITWNYASLTGVSQQRLIYRLPTQTGFTNVQWHYIYVGTNVNLSSTNGQTIAVGNFEYTDPNDYYLINAASMEEQASSFKVVVKSSAISIKNVYTSPDVLYRFPIKYKNTDSSQGAYNINVPNLYYNNTSIKRVNNVDGWGTVITPYGTFNKALRLVSNVTQIDSISIDTVNFPQDTIHYRELEWFDSTKTYPVLYVQQNKVGNNYVTQSVVYFDHQEYYQPKVQFAFLPLNPAAGDTVNFQNLSVNTTAYKWNFGDTASKTNDTSTATNPQHIFNTPGTYTVTLIGINGPLSDTAKLPVVVSGIPLASFTYSPATVYTADTVTFTNTSTSGTNYKWYFGDTASGTKDSSVLMNPTHVFKNAGTYGVRLAATSSAGTDTAQAFIVVHQLVTAVVNNQVENKLSIYPNPDVTNSAYINLMLPQQKDITIALYDITGRLVSVPFTAKGNVGANTITCNISFLQSGVYFVKVLAAGINETRKLIVTH